MIFFFLKKAKLRHFAFSGNGWDPSWPYFSFSSLKLFYIWNLYRCKSRFFFLLIKPFKNLLSCQIPSERDNWKPATVSIRLSKDRPNSTQIQRPNKLAWYFRFTVKLLVGGKCLCYDLINGGTIINSWYND